MPLRKHLLDGLVELGVEEEDLVEARRLDSYFLVVKGRNPYVPRHD
jgi:hypothetical protein